MVQTKSDYYANTVSNNADNPRQLWNCLNIFCNIVPAPSLHNHISIKSFCDSFSRHFNKKISLIRSAFPDHTLNPVQVDYLQATVDEIRKIIMSSQNKSCDLNPLPITLLKARLDKLLTTTHIVNASLCSGLFPDDFK